MTGPTRTAAPAAEAWVGLALVEGLTARKAFELVAACGGAAAALAAGPAVLKAVGLGDGLVARLQEARAKLARELTALGRLDAAVVTWADAAYPSRLRTIADPPLALFVRGSLVPDDDLAVAIVGARRAGEYGRRVAGELARGLAQVGITVVSGLATGIDAAAHRGGLEAGGRTIAVMATGIDRIYPTWNRELARDVVARGALLTEFPVGTPPLQFHFPQRNRIISGLAVGTVVVEAAERSGSLITAEYAVEQGREVFAVPGPIGTPAHGGSHRLIREGAALVRGVEDVIDALAPALRSRLAAARAACEVSTLTPSERRVLDALGEEATHVDAVVGRCGDAPGDVLETLLALELRRLVDQRPGMRFARRGAA